MVTEKASRLSTAQIVSKVFVVIVDSILALVFIQGYNVRARTYPWSSTATRSYLTDSEVHAREC